MTLIISIEKELNMRILFTIYSLICLLFANTNLKNAYCDNSLQEKQANISNCINAPNASFSFANDTINSGGTFYASLDTDFDIDDLDILEMSDDLDISITQDLDGSFSTAITTPGVEGEYYASFESDSLPSLDGAPGDLASVYIYSDGIHDCIASTSFDEARSRYYSNYIASEEDLILLGREEVPENYTYTKTRYQAEADYASITYSGGDIETDYTIRSVDLSGQIRVKGSAVWYDENNNSHPLQGVYLELLDDDFFWNECCDYGYTDENGCFSFLIDNQTFFGLGGRDLFITLYSETKAVFVQSFWWGEYLYETPLFSNVRNNSEIEYTIEIHSGASDRANAFEICQAENIPYNYVKSMSNVNMPIIPIYYPAFNSESCYFYGGLLLRYIAIGKNYYRDWDCLNHEYGHYICKYFSLCDMSVGGDHYINEDLINSKGKINGMKLAMSEGLATYLGTASQMFYSNVVNVPRVGDERYFSINGVDADFGLIHYGSQSSEPFGEGNESSVTSVLIKLLDDVSGRNYDIVTIGHQNMWNIINSNNHWCISSLITDILSEYAYLESDIGAILEAENFSPTLTDTFSTLSTNPNSDCWTFSWNNTSPAVGNSNMFNLYLNSSDSNYSVLNISSNSYTFTNSEKNNILALPGQTIDWHVVGYNTSTQTTGGYPSSTLTVNKPITTTINSGSIYSSYISQGETNWYKFIAPSTTTYTFETTGSTDTYGEIFPSLVIDGSSTGLLVSDDNGGEYTNFKISTQLTTGQTIYLRVRGFSNYTVGSYSLSVSYPHVHNYCDHYQQYSTLKHKAYCSCGDYILESHISNGNYYYIGAHRYTNCAFCGQQIDLNTGGPIINPMLP